jgi:hypothetical protein
VTVPVSPTISPIPPRLARVRPDWAHAQLLVSVIRSLRPANAFMTQALLPVSFLPHSQEWLCHFLYVSPYGVDGDRGTRGEITTMSKYLQATREAEPPLHEGLAFWGEADGHKGAGHGYKDEAQTRSNVRSES